MLIEINEAAEFLKANDNYLIIAHQNPDGDTLGSAFSLCHVLRGLGKKANVACEEGFPQRYIHMWDGYSDMDFVCENVVAVDIADIGLLGKKYAHLASDVKLCIDHHISNTDYAQRTLLDSGASAASEVLYEVYMAMGVTLDKHAAECVYTGIATDTGCFRYGNTTERCHEIAAELFKAGADFLMINRRMFEIKSRARISAEGLVMRNMEFYFDGKCSVICLTKQIMDEFHTSENEFDGLASLTVQPEGVLIGITIKERGENLYKLSLRSASSIDVSALCSRMGGGGHRAAAGCTLTGTLEEVKQQILAVIGEAVG